jgi:hypothetical protein
MAEEESAEAPRTEGMPGLADAMAHVLAKKPKVQGGPILARSKSTLKRLQEEKEERRERRVSALARGHLFSCFGASLASLVDTFQSVISPTWYSQSSPPCRAQRACVQKEKEHRRLEAEKHRLLAPAYPVDVEKKLVRIATRGS